AYGSPDAPTVATGPASEVVVTGACRPVPGIPEQHEPDGNLGATQVREGEVDEGVEYRESFACLRLAAFWLLLRFARLTAVRRRRRFGLAHWRQFLAHGEDARPHPSSPPSSSSDAGAVQAQRAASADLTRPASGRGPWSLPVEVKRWS